MEPNSVKATRYRPRAGPATRSRAEDTLCERKTLPGILTAQLAALVFLTLILCGWDSGGLVFAELAMGGARTGKFPSGLSIRGTGKYFFQTPQIQALGGKPTLGACLGEKRSPHPHARSKHWRVTDPSSKHGSSGAPGWLRRLSV